MKPCSDMLRSSTGLPVAPARGVIDPPPAICEAL